MAKNDDLMRLYRLIEALVVYMKDAETGLPSTKESRDRATKFLIAIGRNET